MKQTLKLLLLSVLAVAASTAWPSAERLLEINHCNGNAIHSDGRSVRYFADHDLDGKDSEAEFAVVVVHGVSGGTRDASQVLRQILGNHPLTPKVFFVAPCFPIPSMLDEAERKQIVYWDKNRWQAGHDSPVAQNLSPYDVLDFIFYQLNDNTKYPNLKRVVFCGYSAGAQVISRYMAVSRIKARAGLSVDFAAGAPSSWLFLDDRIGWHYGLSAKCRYAAKMQDKAILENIKNRHLLCFCGTKDTEDKHLSKTPRAIAQGANRYERFKNFREHISTIKTLKDSFDFVEVDNAGHSSSCWQGINLWQLVFGQGCANSDQEQSSGKDERYASEAELPRIDALAFKSEGSLIYGQVLVPSAKFASPRPCAIFCHGFAGFTRWDDVAHDICRAGIAVVIPHHRGAWGSEGEYTVSGCIRDAENLARWLMDAATAAKYGLDTNAVYLVGHSMGGNSVVNAAARLAGVRGVALVAPCDIGFMAQRMEREALKRFLIGEGMHALHRASDDSVVEDIVSNAAKMRFARVSKALGGKKVFLATGEYDGTVPNDPLEEFWAALGDDVQKSRRTYRAGHSLMGARCTFATDLRDFILAQEDLHTAGDMKRFDLVEPCRK